MNFIEHFMKHFLKNKLSNHFPETNFTRVISIGIFALGNANVDLIAEFVAIDSE